MNLLGLELGDLGAWWRVALAYSELRVAPTVGAIVLGIAAYFVCRWVVRIAGHRIAARTRTEIDDQLVDAVGRVLRMTIVAWTTWRVVGFWQPVLGTEGADGQWVPYARQPADWVWGIWIVVVFIPLSSFVGNLLRAFEKRIVSRRDRTMLDETAWPMINRAIRFTIIALGVLLAMTYLGIEIAPFLAGAGVVGLALSLAAKDTLSNLIAGVLLIMDRPFQVGDRIELWSAPRETGTWGDVIEIGLRATKIRNPDNLVVVVPNNEIMRRDIINYTMSGAGIRLRIPFACAYESDIECAKRLLVAEALQVQGVENDPLPIVIVRGFGPSEVKLELRVWIEQARERRRIADEITEHAMIAFAKAGVEIPYPKRELYIREGKAAELPAPSRDRPPPRGPS